MSYPEASCVMVTARRPRLLEAAIRCYLRQDFRQRELVLVANGPDADISCVPDREDIRVVRLEKDEPIGVARNRGVEAARGRIIVNLDDDDWYAPAWVRTCVKRIDAAPDPDRALSTMWRVLVWLSWRDDVAISKEGTGWCQGSTFAFSKKLWEAKPFREYARDEDTRFFLDHRFWYVPIKEPRLMVYMRHGMGHLGRMQHSHYVRRCDAFGESLQDVVGEEDAEFYRDVFMEKSAL